jgi:hypothetical protein
MNSLFKEKQRFRNSEFKLFFVLLGILPLLLIFIAFDFRQPLNENFLENLDILVISILLYAFLILLLISKLTIFMNQYGIFINLFPFYQKHIVWFRIKEAKIVDCSAVKGWGINFFSRYGIAYKIKGEKGLHIKLNNNKEYLIASKRPEKLEKVVETYRGVHHFK